LNASFKLPSASVCGREIGVGIVLVVFVSLVTFMFSFLGTILCAVMIGMMVGFSRKWRWMFILLSLLFPAVLVVSLHTSSSRSELSLFDNIRLASVGFVTFWGAYAVTRALSFLEGGSNNTSGGLSAVPARLEGASRAEAPSWHELELEESQGAWFQEAAESAGCPWVEQNELTMSLMREDGGTQIVAEGGLQVHKPAAS
jgi:hypothetical protein